MKLIIAVNNLNYIGKDGKMLWKCKEDLQHFKQKTMGSTLIVGKTTHEQCLGGKYLNGRDTFVVGTGYYSLCNAVFEAMKCTICMNNPTIWVIGGSQIYNQLVHLCDEIHISHINNNAVGDTQFLIPSNYRGKVFDYYFDESN